MKLSIQTKPIETRYGLEKTLEIISKAGFDGIDLNLDLYARNHETFKIGDYSSFIFDKSSSEEYAYKLKELLDKYNLKCLQSHAPMPSYYTDETMGKMAIEAHKNSIRICGIVGCQYMTIHPYYSNYIEEPITEQEEEKYNFEVLFPALFSSLEENNVKACLEDLPGNSKKKTRSFRAILTVPEKAIKYVDTLNELSGKKLFGLCLDVGHLMCTSTIPYDYIKAVGDKILITHIHDNDGLHDEHLLPFTGIANWDLVTRAFSEVGYDKEDQNLSLEVFALPGKLPDPLIQPYYNLSNAVGRTLIDKIVNKDF
jgi:sugar phosphate isomerase/epimerase